MALYGYTMSTMSKVTCYFADGKRALATEAIQWVVRRLEQAVADAHAVEGMEENDVCLAAIVD
jgi:alcohol dehydrogenase class IV